MNDRLRGTCLRCDASPSICPKSDSEKRATHMPKARLSRSLTTRNIVGADRHLTKPCTRRLTPWLVHETANPVRTDTGTAAEWVMKIRTLLALTVIATVGIAPARAGIAEGTLPDGSYRCEVYLLGAFLTLGDIHIKGNVYSGPAYFGAGGQGYNYQISPNGEITWLGPLGGFTSGGNSVSLTQITADGEKNASFDIIMRQADGAFTASTCTKRQSPAGP